MAKKIKQFRYYKEEDPRNWPSPTELAVTEEPAITKKGLIDGSFFADYMPISFLGIQALPGTEFYINNSWEPIIIGYTGIFELSLNDLAEITSLRFNPNSIVDINRSENTVLLIDIVYGEEEAV